MDDKLKDTLIDLIEKFATYDNPLAQQENLLDLIEVFQSTILNTLNIACPRCKGKASIAYSNTATWRGGMGGAALTSDICNLCWGTGRSDKTGTDLKALLVYQDNQAREASLEWFKAKIGANFSSTRKQFPALADKLRKIKPSLKGQDFWLKYAANVIAETLDKLGEPTK